MERQAGVDVRYSRRCAEKDCRVIADQSEGAENSRRHCAWSCRSHYYADCSGGFCFQRRDQYRLRPIAADGGGNLSAEEQAKLQKVEDTMLGIEEKMNAAGFTGRVKEAQVLYVFALSDHAAEDGFIDKLVGCFAADQSDKQLIAAVNTAFETELASEDFTKIMENIRKTTSK